jgi:hypothetical protein
MGQLAQPSVHAVRSQPGPDYACVRSCYQLPPLALDAHALLRQSSATWSTDHAFGLSKKDISPCCSSMILVPKISVACPTAQAIGSNMEDRPTSSAVNHMIEASSSGGGAHRGSHHATVGLCQGGRLHGVPPHFGYHTWAIPYHTIPGPTWILPASYLAPDPAAAVRVCHGQTATVPDCNCPSLKPIPSPRKDYRGTACFSI